MLTRVLDIGIALLGLMLLALMYPVIALLIKIDSKGPVFFKCDRVGKQGKIFKMYKFRTMYETDTPLGGSVSPQGDPRVTPAGRLLRRSKLNEFPQFINLFIGNMTLVGPRPESPDLAAAYPPEAQAIFSVKPGLVGPNQIAGRNEEEFYPEGVNPTRYYIESILPAKLPLDLEYIKNKSCFLDLKYFFLALMVTITGAIGRKHLQDNLTQISLIATDIVCCFLSFSAAYYLRFHELLPLEFHFWKLLFIIWLVRIPLLIYFGCYQGVIKYFGLSDLKQLFLAVGFGSISLIVLNKLALLSLAKLDNNFFILDWLCLTLILIAYRSVIMALQRHRSNKKFVTNYKPRRVVIWGADEEGRLCLRYLKYNPVPYEIVGFIDENPKMHNRRIDGLKVLGSFQHLDVLLKLHEIQEIVIAGPGISVNQMDHLRELQNHGAPTLAYFVPRSIYRLTPEHLATAFPSVN